MHTSSNKKEIFYYNVDFRIYNLNFYCFASFIPKISGVHKTSSDENTPRRNVPLNKLYEIFSYIQSMVFNLKGDIGRGNKNTQ